MDEQKKPRAWVYARIPGDYDGTMNSFKVCSMQALRDGCDIVGGSTDEHGGWLLRPGYREMMQQVKVGNVDCIYICRMRQVSGKERHLYPFFRRLMQHGVQITGRTLCDPKGASAAVVIFSGRRTVPMAQYEQACHFAVMTAKRPLVRGKAP